jgi:selenocysteine lyase/cysteine desulfurase
MTNLVEGPFDADRVRALREVLTAAGAGIYLAAHVAGPLPAESMAAVRESDEMDLRVGRAGPDRGEDLAQRDREARAVLAAVLQASPERLVLVHGAADGARLVALEATRTAVGATRTAVGEGPRAIVAVGDHQPSVLAALHDVAEAWRAPFATAPSSTSTIAAASLVAIAHLDGNGTLVDVPRVAEAGRATGARVLLDASMTAGAIALEPASLGVDAVVADSHRWLLGPEATALAWLGPRFGDEVPERMRASVAPFARGTLVALARSVGWLLMYAELPWILARTGALVERLIEGLAATSGVRLLTDREAHAALLAFRIAHWSAEQAADELSRSVFAILEADVEADRLRLGVGAWCRADELDRFVDRVRELAAHTPDTLPRRPTLTVLAGPSATDA